MGVAPQPPSEWVAGFLFVGNLYILDFLNTRPVLEGKPTELLSDTQALARWLAASGLITASKARAILRPRRDLPAGEELLKKLIEFRERLRAAVMRLQAGRSVSDPFVSEVNWLLKKHPCRVTLRRQMNSLERAVVFELSQPEDVWAPIAAATAELLSDIPPSRIRRCEGESCVLHFYDTSKKGSRRWCSMNICGNKLKVAAYQQRNRATAE
jgi:predicted RNA-binding Zn ribbon-like protein